MRVVVLASGAGSLTQALIDAERSGNLHAHLVAVCTDRPAPVISLAKAAKLATVQIAPAQYDSRSDWDVAMGQAVALFNPDLVVSAGFMRILGPAFLQRWGRITINTHPALLPAFPGAHAVRDALAAGVAVTGCTVHRVTADMDAGPILSQRRVAVDPQDDEASLHERIKEAERTQLIGVVNQIADGAIVLT
ncbi:MAG: phosphoribosylglycinamide formyltransferase [Propionibacteriaceae bacterium]|nr:phosphoribosylglycinamide formyltransferase [Propionibacteriaceae bacterium]